MSGSLFFLVLLALPVLSGALWLIARGRREVIRRHQVARIRSELRVNGARAAA